MNNLVFVFEITLHIRIYFPSLSCLQVKVAEGRHEDVSHSRPTEDLTQTFGGADADAGATNVHSRQALHHSPNSSLHSHEHLPSGLLKDFGVSGERGPSNQAHLSDDIWGSNDSPDGCNLSDKHERTMAKLPSVRALTDAAANAPFGSDDEQESSPLATLTGPERDLSSDSSSSRPLKTENDFPEQTDSSEAANQLPTSEDKGTELPQPAPGKEPWDTPGFLSLFILVMCFFVLIDQFKGIMLSVSMLTQRSQGTVSAQKGMTTLRRLPYLPSTVAGRTTYRV